MPLTIFPTSESELPNDPARMLFRMSSVLPEFCLTMRAVEGLSRRGPRHGGQHRRDALVDLLSVGTVVDGQAQKKRDPPLTAATARVPPASDNRGGHHATAVRRPARPRCLLFVVQTTASMRAPPGVAGRESDRPRKLKAALYVVGRTPASSATQRARAGGPGRPGGLLAYRGDGSGGTELLAAAGHHPGGAVPVAAAGPEGRPGAEPGDVRGGGGGRAADASCCSPRGAASATGLAWHSGAAWLLVVHVTDKPAVTRPRPGSAHSPPRPFGQGGQNVDLYHWVLSEAGGAHHVAPGAADLPPGPWRGLRGAEFVGRRRRRRPPGPAR